uniref:LSM14 domain-containing protein n=1 Tax=Caenorhabditis tropicalis TaxID=1561998 RepID=A0A1I7T5N0_9PELO
MSYRKIKNVANTYYSGEAVTGGEVVREGRQISFDVIANVRKLVDPDDPKRTYFEVTVRRMNCLPDPPEFEVEYDDEVESEIRRVLGNATNSAMTFGHNNNEHKPQEKNVVSLFAEGGHDTDKKPRHEPFIGSFGATIFDPTAENKKHGKNSESATSHPNINHNQYTRRILTPKPRISSTPAPTTIAPPVQIQVEPVAQITAPTNTFAFAPLPPFPQFHLPQPNLFQFPAPPAPPLPSPPAMFGVQQASLASAGPQNHQFGIFQQPPQPPMYGGYGLNVFQPAPVYGLQGMQNAQPGQFENLDVYTKSLLTNPSSPFALQMQTFGSSQPASQYFASQLSPMPGLEQNLQRVNIQAPQREAASQPTQFSIQPQSDLNQTPKQDTLRALYHPPPFAALGTTLYNFQTHNG